MLRCNSVNTLNTNGTKTKHIVYLRVDDSHLFPRIFDVPEQVEKPSQEVLPAFPQRHQHSVQRGVVEVVAAPRSFPVGAREAEAEDDLYTMCGSGGR